LLADEEEKEEEELKLGHSSKQLRV